ncbi:hypothetical protein PLICRDRAFT_96682 [Plicaturopsis crispa FD-325 SS-3]|nr:hypothetical protein PLICRDRAFT_96682 [Plicaturopsis crispa FD-325 SS-3]
MASRPPSPSLKHDQPFAMGYFSVPFERFSRDEASDWAGAFTLGDYTVAFSTHTMETFFDSRIDLLQRRLQKHSDRLKSKAQEAFKIKDLSGDLLSENFDREVKDFKLKVSTRISTLAATWHSAKVVRTREKVSFFFSVMILLISGLLFGIAPQWIHILYTLQGLYLLPLRAYTYKKRSWHYFLFDLCYYVTILNFVYLWILPSSPALFVACYALSHGSLASAVITWRNSLVFHDSDKVTSLFVHIYAPFTFTVIRHFYPDAEQRFPALVELPHIAPTKALLLSGAIYMIWQLLYWKFVLIDRRSKIISGQRTTSFSFLLNDKRGVIGRSLSRVPEQFREAAFMLGQLLYAVLTELPAVYVLYDSPFWSATFLLAIFSVSVWNGGGFYIEVFGRKFERELEALRKELAEATARSGRSSPTSLGGSLSAGASEEDLPSLVASPVAPDATLPLPDDVLHAEDKKSR